jgi:hypothetical protein
VLAIGDFLYEKTHAVGEVGVNVWEGRLGGRGRVLKEDDGTVLETMGLFCQNVLMIICWGDTRERRAC